MRGDSIYKPPKVTEAHSSPKANGTPELLQGNLEPVLRVVEPASVLGSGQTQASTLPAYKKVNLEDFSEVDVSGLVANFPAIVIGLLQHTGKSPNFNRDLAIFIVVNSYGLDTPIIRNQDLSQFLGIRKDLAWQKNYLR